MPPQELTGIGGICPMSSPPPSARTTVVTHEQDVLPTPIHYRFVLAWWFTWLPQNPFVFDCFAQVLFLPQQYACNVQLCDWSFAFSSLIISDVCDVKPLVTEPF